MSPYHDELAARGRLLFGAAWELLMPSQRKRDSYDVWDIEARDYKNADEGFQNRGRKGDSRA